MKVLSPVLLLTVLFASCTAEAGGTDTKATQIATDIKSVLEGITTPAAATTAKDKLSGLVDQLAAAMPKLPAAGDAAKGAADLANKAGDMMKAAKGALSGDMTKALAGVTEQVTRIIGNAELLAPIKDIITKLQGLMPGK